ncbi:hypothetical protein ACJMQP_09170 [Rhodopseudomonas palustris]
MRAQHLAKYFDKKVARAIPYTYAEPHPTYPMERNYIIEPVAVEDNIIHARVTLKSVTGSQGRVRIKKYPVICGEVEIIVGEDDSVSDVLAMAVAVSDEQLDLRFLRPGDPIRRAYNIAEKRRKELADSPPQARM